MFELVVKHEFGGHKVGDVITDPFEVARVLASENEASVIKRPAAVVAA